MFGRDRKKVVLHSPIPDGKRHPSGLRKLFSFWIAVGFVAGSMLGRSFPVNMKYVIPQVVTVCALSIIQPSFIALSASGFSTGLLSTVLPFSRDSRSVPEKIYGTFEGRIRKVKPGLFQEGRAIVDVKRFWGTRMIKTNFQASLGFPRSEALSEGERIRFASDLRVARTGKPDNHFLVGSIAQGGWIRSGKKDRASAMRKKVIKGLEGSAGDKPSVLDGILKSIAVGDRSQLSSDISSAMRKTGTYHLLAISGVHLGAAFMLGLLLSRPLAAFSSGAMRPKRFVIVLMSGGLMSCFFYLLITGLSPSATRAAIFIGIAVGGPAVFRESNFLNTLAWSFLIIGILSSTPQPDISLGLSILACLGIWTAVLPGKRGLSAWLEVSMGAYLFTLPLVAIVFRGMPILAPLWNLWIGIPFVVFLIPLAVAGDAVSVLSSTGAHLVFNLWKVLAYPVVSFLHWAGKLKWSYLLLNFPGSLLASLMSALCAVFWWRGSGCLKRRVFLLLIPMVVGLLGHWAGEMVNGNQFQLLLPGLGKADAIIMKADGMTVLVDSGPPGRLSGEPPGARFLRRKGIRRIETLFLTHPHPDHAGGSGYIMRNWKVGSLVLPYTSEGLSLWREVLLDVPPGTPVRFVSPGNQLRIGNMIFRVAGPGKADYRSGEDVNRMSMLIHMSWNDLDILFTGDAAWSGVVEAIKDIDSLDILKVPHHGSGVGFPPEGWEETMVDLAVFPGLISICTAGPEGVGSHPSESVTEWFRKAGMLFLLTGHGNGVNIAYPARGIRRRLGTLLTRDIGSDRKIVIF